VDVLVVSCATPAVEVVFPCAGPGGGDDESMSLADSIVCVQ
jgi:hypothetical protein